jgi:pimeloyl-ACP methyl ester carboxylesterase
MKKVIVLFLIIISFSNISAQSKDDNLCVAYYQTEEEAVKQLERFSKLYSNKEEWLKRAERIKKQIIKGAELEQIPEEYRKAPFNAVITEKKVMDGYTVQNIAIDGMPGDKITGNLYMPLKLKKKNPVIASPHGHWFAPDDYGRFRPDVQKRGAAFAKMGAVVFTYDMIGFGESTTYLHSNPKATQIQLFNSMRVLDYLLSKDYADKNNVVVTGASGGGTQTFLLSALDNRVKVSVPVVMVSAHFFGGCNCESGMPIHKSENYETSNVEIAALFAPKPMLLISDGADWTKNTPKVEYPYIKHIYKFFGAEDNVENAHFADEVHNYGFSKRKAAYKFLAKHIDGMDYNKILDKEGNVDESFVTLQAIQDLKVFKDKSIMFLIDWKHNLSETYERK